MQKKVTDLTVLVAPLDWGLGHTTRCIPIIKGLLLAGCKVLLAGEKAQKSLFEQEFPQIKVIDLKGYRIRYSTKGAFFSLKILQQLPAIFKSIGSENKWLEGVVKTEKIDLVISDNRYGLYHKTIPSILITHQLQLHLNNSWLEQISRRCLYNWINRFSFCWVPDMIDGIADKLSHPTILPKVPVQYINLLSRFEKIQTVTKYKYCYLISGPEPQRTIFEEKIITVAETIHEPIAIVRGVLNESHSHNMQPVSRSSNLIHNHLPTTQLAELVQQSEYIVCRGGYTSLMELLALKKKVIVVPTPGQTEQAYLATTLMEQQKVFSIDQSHFEKTQLADADNFLYKLNDVTAFREEDIDQLLDMLYSNNKISS